MQPSVAGKIQLSVLHTINNITIDNK